MQRQVLHRHPISVLCSLSWLGHCCTTVTVIPPRQTRGGAGADGEMAPRMDGRRFEGGQMPAASAAAPSAAAAAGEGLPLQAQQHVAESIAGLAT